LSKLQIGRGAAFLYIENITAMAYGYAFWYILSKITTPDVIGISSSLISLAAIFTSLASMGIPVASQRFLGKMFLERKFEDINLFIKTSLIITSVGIIACSGTLLMDRDWLYGTYHYNLIVVTAILIASSTISILLRYVIIASLETKKLLITSVISSGVKLLLTIILVFIADDELGVTLGFTIYPMLSAILFGINVRSLVKVSLIKSSFKFIETFRILLRASVVTWIPSLIDTIGGQIGTITVLAIQGSSQAGFYFIAFQISIGISAVIWALESVTFPVLSGMNAERNLFLWRVIKIGLIIVLPLSTSALFYSQDIMQIFGNNYEEGALPLQLLLLSALPTAIAAGISILMYSYGSYREVLLIGLATSIPRILLYFIFIPWYSGTGAALSFTVGSIIGFILSIIISKRFGKIIFWKDLVLIFFIPILFAFPLSIIKIHFVPGIILSIILSYLLLLKLEIVSRNDVQDSLAVLPSNIANPLSGIVNKIGSKLNKNY
jgi:O-antigen/teichoic acid export membrane protein